MNTKEIRVLIVDDHPVVRTGLTSILPAQSSITVLPAASSGHEALTLYEQHGADVVLMDLRMPDLSGIETIRRLRLFDPSVHILVLTNYETDDDIYTALRDGALGYLTKDVLAEEMVQAIRTVASGRRHVPANLAQRIADVAMRPPLTVREAEILQMLITGWTNKRIGQENAHQREHRKKSRNHIFGKLDVTDRTEAVIVALQRGLVKLSGT